MKTKLAPAFNLHSSAFAALSAILFCLTTLPALAQSGNTLGATALLEGPGAGTDSVVLAANTTWTAAANDTWLHLSVANQSGTGSANVVFSYDANPGGTRIGTLTIAGQTLAVTQAGSSYVRAPGPVTTLVSSGLSSPEGVAVDGAGNVYIGDSGNNTIKEWVAASNTVVTLVSSGLNSPEGVAVDGAGNVFLGGLFGAIEELPRAFVDPTAKGENPAAGSDSLPVVLPATENLRVPFAPTSDQSWLTITGVTNGVVSFDFTADTNGASRTAHITLLGQSIPITQQAAPLVIIGPTIPGSGQFQFAFSNAVAGASFTVLTSTNLALPLAGWTVAGTFTNSAPGWLQLSAPLTNEVQRFYRVRWP